jgi:hypothetical protein
MPVATSWPRRARGLVASVAFLLAASACGAILGIGDPAFQTSDGGFDGGGGFDGTGVEASLGTSDGEGGSDGGSEGSDDGGAGDGFTPPGPPCCDGGGCGYLNDDQNCGACFHSCLGGACSEAGVCQPFAVAGSPTTNSAIWSCYGLTILDGTLYGTNWYDSLALVYETSATTLTEAGAGPTALYPDPHSGITGLGSANAIATDGKQLFFAVYQWLNQTWTPGIYSLTTSGAGTLIYPTQGTDYLAADDASVYFGYRYGDIYRMGKDGGAPTSLGGSDRTGDLSLVDGLIYYATSQGIVAVDPQTSDQVLAFGGPPDAGATDAGSASQADGFDVTDAYVVWFNLLTRSVYKSTSQTSTVRLDTSSIPFHRRYATVFGDPARGQIYLFDRDLVGGASISRMADDGSSAQVIATIGDGISIAVQDATAIYFVTYGNQTHEPYAAIYKLAK